MAKRYLNTAFAYAIVAMVLGVFYREFTKFTGFTGLTRLSVMHTHYFMLGMFFFLVALAMEKLFNFSTQPFGRRFYLLYNIGLNIGGAGLFARGLTQVLSPTLSPGLSAAISGVSGLGHLLLGLGIIFFFVALKKQLALPRAAA